MLNPLTVLYVFLLILKETTSTAEDCLTGSQLYNYQTSQLVYTTTYQYCEGGCCGTVLNRICCEVKEAAEGWLIGVVIGTVLGGSVLITVVLTTYRCWKPKAQKCVRRLKCSSVTPAEDIPTTAESNSSSSTQTSGTSTTVNQTQSSQTNTTTASRPDPSVPAPKGKLRPTVPLAPPVTVPTAPPVQYPAYDDNEDDTEHSSEEPDAEPSGEPPPSYSTLFPHRQRNRLPPMQGQQSSNTLPPIAGTSQSSSKA